MKAKRMSYSMCLVFAADYRRMLEDRKEQPLTLCAGQAVTCGAWSVCAQRETVHGRAQMHARLHQSVGGRATDVHSIVTEL